MPIEFSYRYFSFHLTIVIVQCLFSVRNLSLKNSEYIDLNTKYTKQLKLNSNQPKLHCTILQILNSLLCKKQVYKIKTNK